MMDIVKTILLFAVVVSEAAHARNAWRDRSPPVEGQKQERLEVSMRAMLAAAPAYYALELVNLASRLPIV